jgi:hypothetical protein
VDTFDRLCEIVPDVVESLIKGEGLIISERVERVDAPRGRGPNLTDTGEGSWLGSISRGAANASAVTGSGGK